MAYLPPHKRHSNTGSPSKPTPPPSSLIPQFNQTLTLGVGGSRSKPRTPRRRQQDQGTKILYASNSVARWFIAGSAVPDSIRLEPYDCEGLERKNGVKPLVLVRGGGGDGDGEEGWVKIAERVGKELVECWKSVSSIDVGNSESLEAERMTTKLSFVARFGKVLFFGNAVDLEAIRRAADTEADSRKQVNKLFYTNVSETFLDNLQHIVVPKIGFEFDSEKEHYHVKVFDRTQPDSTISCKCTVANDGGALEIHKIELNHVRNLVIDISCPHKDQDLRFMLVTKRTMKTMNDEENDGITKLIKSAVIDPDVKGGLRWPLGKESVGDRFSIVGVWHTKYKLFKSKMMTIKLRHADRFDHMTSIGEVTTESSLKLPGISRHLRDGNIEQGDIKEMVQEVVKLIWDEFLSCNHAT